MKATLVLTIFDQEVSMIDNVLSSIDNFKKLNPNVDVLISNNNSNREITNSNYEVINHREDLDKFRSLCRIVDHVKTEFFFVMDPDDSLEDINIDELLKQIDITSYNVNTIVSDEKYISSNKGFLSSPRQIIGTQSFKQGIDKYGLSSMKVKMGDDIMTALASDATKKNINIIDIPFYIYENDPSSMSKDNTRRRGDYFEDYMIILETVNKIGIDEINEALLTSLGSSLFGALIKTSSTDYFSSYKEWNNWFEENILEYKKTPLYSFLQWDVKIVFNKSFRHLFYLFFKI